MTAIHFLLPAAIDDRSRPSGGNTYDRNLSRGLVQLGWQVIEHRTPGHWPRREDRSLSALADTVASVSDGTPLLVDGLVASVADDVLVRAAARVPVVVLLHLPLGLAGPADGSTMEREHRVLRAASLVVVTSEWTRLQVSRLYGLPAQEVVVARPGVAPTPISRGCADGGHLLAVGAVTPIKGHDVLVTALSDLVGQEWQCNVAGALDVDVAHVRRVRAQLATSPARGRVTFAGPLTGNRLESAYRVADLLVAPSRTESYGMAITEALARGIPVVASDVGGVREALGRVDGYQPGLLVPPGDPAALSAALACWLEDDLLRRRLRTRARARRRELQGWHHTAGQVAAALARL